MERPTKCYIRQEWFEAASYLQPAERCQFYEALMAYVYYERPGDNLSPAVRGMFEMCKTFLREDCTRYNQIVVRNRQNGSNGGRPRRGLTQNNPEEPKLTQSPPHIHIHNNNINLSPKIPLSDVERESCVMLELFACGAGNYTDETEKLIDYYNARGWVDKGGNKIVDPAALARVWKCDNKSTYYVNIRKRWAEFCRSTGKTFNKLLLTEFQRFERKEINSKKTAIIYCRSAALPEYVEKNCLDTLKLAIKVWQVENIQYMIENASEGK